MKSFTISFVLATVLGLLQLGAETKAAASPIPPPDTSSNGNSYKQFSYPQPDMSQYYMPQYAQPQYAPQLYAPPQYDMQQYVTQQEAPSYTASQLPGEFEGLSTENAVVGNKNIQFKGFDVLSDLNLPANVLSITDILG